MAASNLPGGQRLATHRHLLAYCLEYVGAFESLCLACVNTHQSVTTTVYHIFKNTSNMKNGVFWDVTPYGSCKNRRFGGT
jgi:hypothetical protein